MNALGLAAPNRIRCQRAVDARPIGGSLRLRGLVVDSQWARLIPLGGAGLGSFMVDVADVPWVSRWTWNVIPSGYICRTRRIIDGPGPQTIYLHRELMRLRPGDGLEADHINRNRRDNRRSNLRILTTGGNAQNKPSLGGSSRFRGVTWDKNRQKWMASAQLDGRRHNLGRFDDEEVAARAASDWRREHMPFSNEDVA